MNREAAFALLGQYVKNENMIRHCLASEAVLRALAVRLNQDAELWAIAGLVHDVDVEITGSDPAQHCRVAAQLLADNGYPQELIAAVRLHNEAAWPGEKRASIFQHALAAGETITGLITATTLVYPDKKLASVKSKSVVKRMKETKFAASVSRENIMECELTGVPLPEFAELAVNAMREIAPELGL
ncbi:MAG: HDIG domain-containing protein [Elusimicrobiaceae bacterium]|nr:HDIG domain-containing protein [Elusimicrobiaceae bacterium]